MQALLDAVNEEHCRRAAFPNVLRSALIWLCISVLYALLMGLSAISIYDMARHDISNEFAAYCSDVGAVLMADGRQFECRRIDAP